MRLIVVLAVIVGIILFFAGPARAEFDSPELSPAASWIAGHHVYVSCAAKDEFFADDDGQWGSTFLNGETVWLGWKACAGAMALVKGQPWPDTDVALGILALTHEAYHQRQSWAGRANEAQTHCKAIRHFTYMAQKLGASPEYAKRLLGYGVMWYWYYAARAHEGTHQKYYLPSCNVPVTT